MLRFSTMTTSIVLSRATLTLAAILLLAAGGLLLAARTGEGWAWLGYYFAAAIAIFEVPAVVLAVVAQRASTVAPGRRRVTAAAAALLAPGPLLLWGLWGLCS
jgi:hypothetical protein